MELPNAKYRQEYIDSIKALEDKIKSATEGGEISDLDLHIAQENLDSLAEKYKDEDRRIGSAAYKLYELQAFIHYFNNKDDEALDFISHAIDIKGGTYPKAENLKKNLSASSGSRHPGNVDGAKASGEQGNLVGLKGWLAVFIVGQFLSILITVFRFFSDGFISSSEVDSINQYQAGLGTSLSNLIAFENLAMVVYIGLVISTIVLLFLKRKLAKNFAITALLFVAIYGIVDYGLASSLFGSSDLFQTPEIRALMNSYAGDVGRNLITVLIWVPYFLVSKRVKATLTK